MADREAVEQLVEGSNVIIHIAAHTRVIDSIEDPVINFDINCREMLEVLEAARK